MKDERAYLLHAIEAIDAILSYTVDGREAFFSDGKTQDAVIRNIEIIGQASRASRTAHALWSQRCPGGRSQVCATSSSTNTTRRCSQRAALVRPQVDIQHVMREYHRITAQCL